MDTFEAMLEEPKAAIFSHPIITEGQRYGGYRKPIDLPDRGATAPRKMNAGTLASGEYTIPPSPYRAPPNNAPAATPRAPKATLESEMAKIVSTIRPDYADDIDAKVATLVSSGDVVLDAETDMYRRPHYRRYRFTTS